MGFSESDSSKCRRHPNPRQLPGVCPSCLREKLCKLDSTTAGTRAIAAPSSSSSALSTTTTTTTTSSSSTRTATTAHSRHHRRNGSEVPAYVSVGMVLNTGLKKSRSVSCAPLSCKSIRDKTNMDGNNNVNCNNIKCVLKNGNNNNEKGDNNQDKEGEVKSKKKLGGGFLKKLIHTTSKKTKGALKHSKTMKERSSAQSHHGDNTSS